MDGVSEELSATLSRLTELSCSSVVAGQGVGTAISLDFGRVVRKTTIDTARGSREGSVFELSVFIQDSTWRLEDSSSVICSSAAIDNSEESDLVQGLKRFLHRRVIEVKQYNTALDLMLGFENGFVLHVFSVPITDDPHAENYSVFTPEKVFTVRFDGKIAVSPRLVAIHK